MRFILKIIVLAVVIFAPKGVSAQPDDGSAEAQAFEKSNHPYRKYQGAKNYDVDKVYERDSDLYTYFYRPPEFGPWMEIDGQRVRGVYYNVHRSARFQGSFISHPTFAGLENAKGKVLLPCVFREVHLLPGVGVVIRSHLKGTLYEKYNIKTGARTPVPDVFEIQSNLGPQKELKAFVIIKALGEKIAIGEDTESIPNPADLVGPAVAGAVPAPAKKPAKTTWEVELARMEFFDEKGQSYLTLEKVSPVFMQWTVSWDLGSGKTLPVYFPKQHGFKMTSPLTPSGERALLLFNEADWKHKSDFMPRVLPVRRMGLMIPSPFMDKVWLKLAPDGKSFGSPPGTLGYMPVEEGESFSRWYAEGLTIYEDLTTFWALPYQTPEGIRWGYLDPTNQQPSGPVWKHIELLSSPIFAENHGLVGSVIAVQEMNGKWKTMYRAEFPRIAKPILSHVPGRVSEGPGHDSKAALLEFAEQKTLEYRAQKIASDKAYDKWQKHYNEVERPRLARERRWADAWNSGNWHTVEVTAEALGGQYFVEFVQKFPQASSEQLLRAAALEPDATKKAALEQRVKLADLRMAREAEARKRAIAAERLRTVTGSGVRAAGSSPGWDSWAAYRDQSARNATKLQAMNDYLYGKSNNPLLNPFK